MKKIVTLLFALSCSLLIDQSQVFAQEPERSHESSFPGDYPFNAAIVDTLEEWLAIPLDTSSTTIAITDWSQPAIYTFGSKDCVGASEEIMQAMLPHGANNEYTFLSNFYPCEFVEDGYTYPTTEHYYQSHKLPYGSEAFLEVLNAKTPLEAKTLARYYNATFPEKYPMPSNETLINNMKRALWHKFVSLCGGPTDLGEKLAETGNCLIVEGNKRPPYSDSRWGCEFDFSQGYDHVTLTGENWLGKLLMEIRSQV